MDSFMSSSTIVAILILATTFAGLVIIGILVGKKFSKKQTKKIVVPESQTRRLDMDKIAKGLGAERGGELKANGGYFGAMGTAAQIAPTIIEAKEDFQIKLEDALVVAGLPTDPRQIIGQKFSFEANIPRTAEHHTLIGTIVGLEISNLDKGVDLYLSTRRFHNLKIERLHIEYVDFLNERHHVLVFKDSSAIPGQFRLLNS